MNNYKNRRIREYDEDNYRNSVLGPVDRYQKGSNRDEIEEDTKRFYVTRPCSEGLVLERETITDQTMIEILENTLYQTDEESEFNEKIILLKVPYEVKTGNYSSERINLIMNACAFDQKLLRNKIIQINGNDVLTAGTIIFVGNYNITEKSYEGLSDKVIEALEKSFKDFENVYIKDNKFEIVKITNIKYYFKKIPYDEPEPYCETFKQNEDNYKFYLEEQNVEELKEEILKPRKAYKNKSAVIDALLLYKSKTYYQSDEEIDLDIKMPSGNMLYSDNIKESDEYDD